MKLAGTLIRTARAAALAALATKAARDTEDLLIRAKRGVDEAVEGLERRLEERRKP